MAFVYRCPFCTFEHTGEAADVGKRTQCRQCEYSFKIGAPAARDMIADAGPRVRDRRTLGLWVGALAFVGLLGGGFFGVYQARYGWESKHRHEVEQLSADAEDALARGDEKKAYVAFAKVADLGHGHTHVSEDLKSLITRAEAKRDDFAKVYGPLIAATSTAPAATMVAAAHPANGSATQPAASAPAVAALPLGANLTAEQIVGRYSRSVALIKSPIGSGTGFVVGPNLVLTNYHVIAESPISQLRIYFPASDNKDVAAVPTGLVHADGKRDLALLSVTTGERPLSTASAYSFKPGQNVVVIGNPGVGPELILENAVSAGIMSTKMSREGYDYFQMSIAINPGNSGGPVFDSNGEVVGVATLKAKQQEGIAFAVPASDVIRAVNAAGRRSPGEVAKITADHNQIAVCRRVSLMSGVYHLVMAAYVEAMRDAPPAGQAKALADTKAKMQEKLSKVNAEAMADIDSMVQGFVKDPAIAQATRDRISEEWAMYTEAKNIADNPRQPVAAYESAMVRSIARRVSAVKALQTALGVDDLLGDE